MCSVRPSSPLPIACSLGADALMDRRAELAELGAGLLAVDRSGPGAALRFESGQRAALKRIVAAEAKCCPFLVLTIMDGDTLELTISGPPEAAGTIDELVDAIASGASA